MTAFTPDRVKRATELVAMRIEELKINLSSGAARSFEEYRETVGEIRGLGQLESIFNQLRTEAQAEQESRGAKS